MLQKNINPAVSVIIPTFNRPDTLIKAINSILNQTFRDFEIIVINDGGENVKEKLDFCTDKLVYINSINNAGRSAARNLGLKAAKGKYIAYLDDDDIFFPNHLEILTNVLESENYDAVHSLSIILMHEKINGSYIEKSREICDIQQGYPDEIYVHNYLPVICLLHRRECLDEGIEFDPVLNSLEDWDFIIKLMEKYTFKSVPLVTCEFIYRKDKLLDLETARDYLRSVDLIYERILNYTKNKPDLLEKQKKSLEGIYPEIRLQELKEELFQKGLFNFENGNFEKAEKIFFRLTIYENINELGFKFLGITQFKLNKYKDALDSLSKSLKLGSKMDYETSFTMAQCLEKEGNQQVADAFYKTAKALQ